MGKIEKKRKIRTTHRSVRERWVITGTLVLETPAHFGGTENDGTIDMPILKDETDGVPLIPGTSIAGALRSYLREIEIGDNVPFPKPPAIPDKAEANQIYNELKARERSLAATLLFGVYREDDEGSQSPLIVYDASGKPAGFELRDGVKIDGTTRTAQDKKKFDIELLSAGTSFDLIFELVIGDKDDFDDERRCLLSALATALNGLEKGHISLGARKNRGYGKCSVSGWTVRRYSMSDPAQFLAWLASERKGPAWIQGVPEAASIAEALGETVDILKDNRQHVTLHAEFLLKGSVMIRSGFGDADTGPDMVHLHSKRRSNKKPVPIISGTTWAGILRHRAERIVRTLSRNGTAKAFTDEIFGPLEIETGNQNARASRLSVSESEITGGHGLVQSRIKIDRFTGGVCEGALFEEQPLFGNGKTCVSLDLILRSNPQGNGNGNKDAVSAEIGLLLLLLKDLWTGDLPVGGESSVGRGRLQGQYATLKVEDKEWFFTQTSNGGLNITGDHNELESFVDTFNRRMTDNG